MRSNLIGQRDDRLTQQTNTKNTPGNELRRVQSLAFGICRFVQKRMRGNGQLAFAAIRIAMLFFVFCSTVIGLTSRTFADGLPVAELTRKNDVDFAREVLPILRKNCLACHNETEAEGDLILESVETILKGGSSGPAVVKQSVAESYLFTLASHADEPIMPPEDNEVGASNLSPQELAILKLWIEQGAPEGSETTSEDIAWQSLPNTINPVLAVSTSKDGSLLAVGRANQIYVHHGRSGMSFGQLADVGLSNDAGQRAHLDMVQALSFSPDNQWLVSGGYRTAKIWKQSTPLMQSFSANLPISALAEANSGQVFSLSESHVSVTDPNGDSTKFAIAMPIAAATTNDDENVVAINATNVIVFDRKTGTIQGQFDIPSTDVAAVSNGRVVTAAGNEINVFELAPQPNVELDGKFTLSGHSAKVTSLVVRDDRIVSSGADNTIRVWSISEKKQLKQIDTDDSIEHLAFSQTANRIVATLKSGETRIWDAGDGKLIGTVNSDQRLQSQLLTAQLIRDVANRQVDNANKDADGSKKRLKEEEENLKKSNENKKKADEAKKKKEEELAKAKSEHSTTEKAVAELQAKIAAAKNRHATTSKEIEAAKQTYDNSLAKLAKTQTAYAEASMELANARNTLRETQTKLDADKENETLKRDVATAKATVDQANMALSQSDDARSIALAETITANDAKKSSDSAFKDAKTQLEQLSKQLVPKEKAIADKKKIVTAKEKELTDAIKTLETAVASIAQANRAIDRAQNKVTEFEQALASAKQAAAERETEFKKAESTSNAFRFVVRDTALCPDGTKVAVLNENGDVHVFATSNASAIHVIAAGAHSIAFIDNSRIAATSDDGKVNVWRATPKWGLEHVIGSPDDSSPLSDRITAIAISPDSQTLALGGGEPSRGGELKLYRLSDGHLISDLTDAHSDTVYSIAFSPDGTMIASGAADRFMKVFRVATGELVRNFEGHTHHVLSVSWQADGRVLASAGADKVVKLWNMADGSQLKTIQGFGKEVTSLQHYGANDQFVAVCGDKAIYRCDQAGARNGIGRGNDFLYTVSSNADGKTVAFAGHDSIVRVIDSQGKADFELPPTPQNPPHSP